MYVAGGAAHISNFEVENATNGIYLNTANSKAYITGSFTTSGITNAHVAAENGATVQMKALPKFDNVANVGGWSIPAVASADPLTLPLTGDFFKVTGTTGFGNLWGAMAGEKSNPSLSLAPS